MSHLTFLKIAIASSLIALAVAGTTGQILRALAVPETEQAAD